MRKKEEPRMRKRCQNFILATRLSADAMQYAIGPRRRERGGGGPGKVRDTPVWAVTAGVRRWSGCWCVVVRVTPSAWWWWWSWWSLVVVTSRLMLSSRCGYSLELGTCTHRRTARVFVRCSSSSFVDCAAKPQVKKVENERSDLA